MIPSKIQDLFSFIDFLYSNLSNLKESNKISLELDAINEKRRPLNPNYYYEKIKLDELKIEYEETYQRLINKLINPIKLKIIDLSIFEWSHRNNIYNYFTQDLIKLKDNIDENNVPRILEVKSKYESFRNEVNCDYFPFFIFSELDNTLSEIFTFFELPEKQIIVETNHYTATLVKLTFSSEETKEKTVSMLKGLFPNKSNELSKAIEGEELPEKIIFQANGNKFVEVFKRLKYNKILLNSSTEIKEWICLNFNFNKLGNISTFNENYVWDVLTKQKSEPSKKSRICVFEWLPHIPQNKRTKEN